MTVTGASLYCTLSMDRELRRGQRSWNKLRYLIPPRDRAVVLAQVAVGRPVPEILRAVRAINAELLVIGATPRTRVGSRLFGETGQILRDARCPVLAVPALTGARAEGDGAGKIAA